MTIYEIIKGEINNDGIIKKMLVLMYGWEENQNWVKIFYLGGDVVYYCGTQLGLYGASVYLILV